MFDESTWLFGDPGSLSRKQRVRESATAFAARAYGASPFPAAAAKILTLTEGDAFNPRAIVEALESDPPIAARVLRLVNSSSYGLRTRCASIRHAVPLLGASGVRLATLAGSVLCKFPGNGNEAWKRLHGHAMATAGLARQLAPEWRVPSDEMFTAAFLHDIGKWVLLEHEPDYALILMAHGGACEGTLEEERGQLGFDHAELTEHMLAAWGIPQPIPRIAGLHHDPTAAYSMDTNLAVRVALVRLANLLAHAIAEGKTPDFDALAVREPLSYLELSAQSLRERYAFFRSFDEAAREEQEGKRTTSPRAGVPQRAKPLDRKEEEVCAYCDCATFGVRCARCGARLCDQHTPPRGKLCAACEATFWELAGRRASARTALAVGGASAVALGAAAWLGHTEWGALFCCALTVGAGVMLAWRRWSSRRAFLEGS